MKQGVRKEAPLGVRYCANGKKNILMKIFETTGQKMPDETFSTR
jgi:hypothetical protein